MGDPIPRLIVGLGNPGRRYERTWHNLGWMVLDELARIWRIEFKPGRFDCSIAEYRRPSRTVMLLKPLTYMNLSGGAVSQFSRYYKIGPDEILVIFDDHDLPLGRMRMRLSGSAGGHRGMGDVIKVLGTENIPRLRIGIKLDAEPEKGNLADQVLSVIPAKLSADVMDIIVAAADAVRRTLEIGPAKVMNEVNRMGMD